MPSIAHETLVDLVRHRPDLIPGLLSRALGIEVPAHERVSLEPADCTALTPTEYRADAVVVLHGRVEPGVPGRAVLAVVVEVQLGRDSRKRRSWPVYVATLHARLGCPTALLVICPDPAIAAWCAHPIEFGPGWHGAPLVLGPDQVPITADPGDVARAPELAVLSALAHGANPAHRRVLDVLAGALANLELDRARLYAELVLAALPRAAHDHLEALMNADTYPYQSHYARKLLARGEQTGMAVRSASAVLAVLEARGIDLPADLRARIADCTDLDQLDAWLRTAATADTAADLVG